MRVLRSRCGPPAMPNVANLGSWVLAWHLISCIETTEQGKIPPLHYNVRVDKCKMSDPDEFRT